MHRHTLLASYMNYEIYNIYNQIIFYLPTLKELLA